MADPDELILDSKEAADAVVCVVTASYSGRCTFELPFREGGYAMFKDPSRIRELEDLVLDSLHASSLNGRSSWFFESAGVDQPTLRQDGSGKWLVSGEAEISTQNIFPGEMEERSCYIGIKGEPEFGKHFLARHGLLFSDDEEHRIPEAFDRGDPNFGNITVSEARVPLGWNRPASLDVIRRDRKLGFRNGLDVLASRSGKRLDEQESSCGMKI